MKIFLCCFITFIMVSTISSSTIQRNAYSVPCGDTSCALSHYPTLAIAYADSDTMYTPGKEPTPPPPPFDQ